MQFALNENNERINIKDAISGEKYYCPFELWFYIKPYERGEITGEQYGFTQYAKIYKGKGFVKVLGTYNDCKTVIGDIYTEEQFYKYITSL